MKNRKQGKFFFAFLIFWGLLGSLFAPAAIAAIAVDGTASHAIINGGTQYATCTHTVGSGSNRLLLVGISWANDDLETVTSVVWKYGEADAQNLQYVGSVASSNDARVEIWKLVAPNTGSAKTVRVTFSAALQSQKGGVLGVMSFTGVDQSTPLGTFVSDWKQNTDPPATVNVTSATGELVFDTVAVDTPGGTFAAGGGQTEQWNDNDGYEAWGGGSTEAGASTVTMSWTWTGSTHWAIGAVPIKPASAPAVPLEQEGFRFRDDNGNESGATWLAAQDTFISRAKNTNTRLRVLVNTTGNPDSQEFQLEFKKTTSSNYEKVLTASPAIPNFQAIGTPVSGTSAVSPAWPAHQANDVALLFVESTGGETALLSTPAGFVEVTNSPQATGTGTAGTRITVFWCRATSSSMPTPTAADPGNHVYAVILTFRGVITVGNPWDVTAGGVKATASTTTTFNSVTTTVPNCLIVLAASRDNDSTSAAWSGWTNANLSNLTERQDGGTTSNNGGGIGVATGGLATAGSTGASTATVTSSVDGHMTIALKPPSSDFILSLSTQFDDGDSTTAQLDAPSGKTKDDYFTAGKMQESNNPAAGVNIDNNYYTEMEWCLKATDAAVEGEIYEFRVTNNGVPLTTYSVTPLWEVGLLFGYRRAITIQESKVTCTSNLSNYPLLVSLSGDWLKPVASGGKIQNYGTNDPYDLIFRVLGDSTTCGGVNSCNLDHEVEKWDSTTGTLLAWVRIPVLKYNTNTTIYVFYGNPGVTSSTQNKSGVWNTSNGWRGVWHLEESSGNALDSTSYGTSGSVSGTVTRPSTGQTGNAYDFGTNGQVAVLDPADGHLDFGTGSFTVSFWLNVDASTGTTQVPIHKGGRSTSYPGYDFETGSDGQSIMFEISTSSTKVGTDFTSLTYDTWTYIAGVVDRANQKIRIYKNGVQQGTEKDISSVGSVDSTEHLLISNAAYGNPIDGSMDEVRVWNDARPACWLETEYNNQHDISTFISVATSDEGPAPTAVILASFSGADHEEGVLLEWRTGFEANNLGFNLYREESGQLIQVNPGLIKGSALLTGAETRTAGYSYTWWDTSVTSHQSSVISGGRSAVGGQRSVVRYWLEDLDLNGAKTLHGPVTPVFSPKPAPKKAQSMLLSQINKHKEKPKATNVTRYSLLDKTNGQSRITNNDSRITNNEALGGGQPSVVDGRRSAVSSPRTNIVVSSVDEGHGSLQPGQGHAVLSDKTQSSTGVLQKAIAARPSVRIFIQEEGWYRVTQPELMAAGMDPAVNPRFLQLFVDGQEQPILVRGGAIEFYGTGLDTPYTDTRVYWLVPGSKPGKRIDSHIFNPQFRPWSGLIDNPHSARGRVSSTIRNSFESFPYTVEKKDRTIYVAALKNGEASNFFGAVVSSAPVDQVLKVSHLDSGALGDAVLEVSLQGVSAGAHQVMVLVNGVVAGTMAFADQTLKAGRFPLVQAGLVEGENVVTLAGQGVPLDVSLVDSIRLTYWRTYTAEEDILKFTSVGGNNLSVNGFSSSSIRVMDMTDLQNLKEVGGTVQGEGGGYSFRFQVPGNGKRTLLAFVDEEARTPAALELNQPSRWHQAKQGADLVIISHGLFLESLEPLKAFRESQGLSVALIDVEDLYDEFSFGIKTPQAIKDFLQRAKSNWQKPPRFVLLVGDASFDPRNYYGFGNFDLIPTKLVDTNYIETASDDWFVDFNNDGLPDIAIGRIPVRTAEEAASVVSKLIGYEQSREQMKDVLLVADMRDKDFDYMAASVGVKAILPQSVMVSEIYRDQFPDDVQVKSELLRRLNQGPLLVNYIGHGTLEFWRGDIFGSDDAETLTNGLRLPFVVGMTCLNGFFHDVYYETLPEALLKAKDGGAVAVWTSSGLTEPDKQAVMNKEMVRVLFNGEGLTIGEAAMRAKAAVTDMDIRKTWILFGDPTTLLKSR